MKLIRWMRWLCWAAWIAIWFLVCVSIMRTAGPPFAFAIFLGAVTAPRVIPLLWHLLREWLK